METERWTYGGKFLDKNKGRLLDLWYATDQLTRTDVTQDIIRLYSRWGTSCILGGIYEVNIDDELRVHGSPHWTGEYCERDIKLQLSARDSEARTNHRRLRHEKAEGEKDELDIALAPLVKLATSCRTRHDRDALIATVLRRMSDAW